MWKVPTASNTFFDAGQVPLAGTHLLFMAVGDLNFDALSSFPFAFEVISKKQIICPHSDGSKTPSFLPQPANIFTFPPLQLPVQVIPSFPFMHPCIGIQIKVIIIAIAMINCTVIILSSMMMMIITSKPFDAHLLQYALTASALWKVLGSWQLGVHRHKDVISIAIVSIVIIRFVISVAISARYECPKST